MTVVTRFAPSPTGYLHIGSARTALFNYLFAKHHNGKFLLRVEDTDIKRSTTEAKDAIMQGLNWLNIHHDDSIIYQSHNIARHQEVARLLLQNGNAYKCFMSQEEINAQREDAMRLGHSFLLNSPWRDADERTHPKDQKFVIRIKAPRVSESIIYDIVQGEVRVEFKSLDDMILLRSDGTPTYMLAVVVDDHDMKITHIIRGDDHLNNAFRQKLIYNAMGWEVPVMAHIPLIHGPDGAKLSKRHGALDVSAYEEMGYLPESLINYLMRLGWSHGDDEVISVNDAIKWFDGTHIGKGPAKIDFAKMTHLNSLYLRKKNTSELISMVENHWKKDNIILDERTRENLELAMEEIKLRSSRTTDLSNLCKIYHNNVIYGMNSDALEIISKSDKASIIEIYNIIKEARWNNISDIKAYFQDFATSKNIKLGDAMKLLRALLTGTTASPSIFELINIIGKEATILRIEKFIDDQDSTATIT